MPALPELVVAAATATELVEPPGQKYAAALVILAGSNKRRRCVLEGALQELREILADGGRGRRNVQPPLGVRRDRPQRREAEVKVEGLRARDESANPLISKARRQKH